ASPLATILGSARWRAFVLLASPQEALDVFGNTPSLGLVPARGALRIDPEHLHGPALTIASLKAVERSNVAAESQKRAPAGFDFPGVVMDVCFRVKYPQPSTGLVPGLIQIDENGNLLCNGVVVNVPVIRRNESPNRHLGWVGLEI